MMKWIQKHTGKTRTGKMTAAAALLVLSMSVPSYGTDLARQPGQSATGPENTYSLAGAGSGEIRPPGETSPETMPGRVYGQRSLSRFQERSRQRAVGRLRRGRTSRAASLLQ